MAIDHGLGGKDNKKSSEKRAKRAARQKNKAHNAIVGGKKRQVIFNEEDRVEWLTGFRKRKQERRKYGLTQQLIKDRKILKEKRKSLRIEKDNSEAVDDKVMNTGQLKVNESLTQTTEEVFNDEHTRDMFGGAVSILIKSGIDCYSS
jgi:ribosomal RNA-processing protein 17